ncbi:MAG: DUF6702 family protein [Gemmatimonadaceae bacterium]
MNSSSKSTARRRVFGRASLAITLMLGASQKANAHPIHTTLTKVSVEAHAVTFNVRAFADDFSATVAKFSGRKPPVDSSALAADVLRYVQSFFTVTNAEGKPVVLESCGIKRVNELYWMCFKVSLPAGNKGVRVRNQMLTEFHADQVNIVQFEAPAARRTMLFTKGSAPALISD